MASANRPARLLVGFAPGGSSDIVARLIAMKLTEVDGQHVVVENRAGAGGSIAAEAVSRSKPDGQTWLIAPSGHATLAAMRKKLPFDPVKDFSWVSTITTYPLLIGVRPDSPYKTLQDVLDAARKNPGKISFSSVGMGTAHHLLGEWLNAAGKVELLHVPFKGDSLALTEVLAGRVDLFISTMTAGLAQVQSGRIRAIAVSSAKPFPLLPSVPTIDSTLPGVAYESWLGIAVAPNTPPAIVDHINAELRKVLALPDVKKKLADLGGQASPSTPEQFRDRVARDIERFDDVVKVRHIEKQ
ncbi:tripartite tricarboxylate transporter substrate binding protein [Candidimonas nitroreducens]|nr:tripartite tricarboxylate transporter substrate binding protein [Candidimonas nitroreducens]